MIARPRCLSPALSPAPILQAQLLPSCWILSDSGGFTLAYMDANAIFTSICTEPTIIAAESEMPAMQEQERWLSVEEIAAHLGVNRDTIYKWIERKHMPAHKLGKLWKFKATEIDEWIRQGKAGEDSQSE